MNILYFCACVAVPILLVIPVVSWIFCERQYQKRLKSPLYCIQYDPDNREFDVIDADTGAILYSSCSISECEGWIDGCDTLRSTK